MSSNPLTQIPDLPGSLLILLLNNLTVTQLPIFNTSGLSALDLSFSSFQVDDRFFNLLSNSKNLSALNLGGLSIQNFTFLDSMISLKELSLASTGLVEIPLQIYSLSNLEKLELERNAIRGVPQQLENLTKLESINLNNNLISDVAPNLTFLKNLALKNNSLSFSSLVNLCSPNLQSLDISHNNISSLPLGWGSSFRNLSFLDLSFNSIYSLKNVSILLYQILITLNLDNNMLREIPEEIGESVYLRNLYFSNNFVSLANKFPSNLVVLRAYNNSLKNTSAINFLLSSRTVRLFLRLFLFPI